MTVPVAVPGDHPRLLIVVSRDHGELTNALSFADGSGCAAVLLLPPALYAQNSAELGSRALCYTCRSDIDEVVDRLRPNLVVLFSGYLMVINQLLDLPDLAALLARMEQRGIQVATSDPFLGLLLPGQVSPFNPAHPLKTWFDGHFARVGKLLAPLPHIYSGPPDAFYGTRKLGFHHPDREATPERASLYLMQQGAVPGTGPVWLYVLSNEDYGIQVQHFGATAFHNILGARLHDARAAGARPVLIAPQACIDGAHAVGATATAFGYCGRALFTALSLAAQYVFYWNMLSHSLLQRLAHRLPLFFFDYGHMMTAAPPLFALARASYLKHGALAPMDVTVALDAMRLADAAAGAAPERAAAAAHLLALPSPCALVASLLKGGPE